MKINWKYAIGEVLIVIIGISLAFALNNWKERGANSTQKKQYLENLALDINQEISQLERNQEAVNEKLKTIEMVKPFLGKDPGRRDTIIRKVFELARLVNFYPENSTYQTLINSGDMKLIGNFQLRRSLEEHFALHKIVLQDYERIEKIHEKYLGDFFIYHINFNELRFGNTDFLDNPLIANIITSVEGAYYLVLKGNERCLKSNKDLLEKIEAELNNVT
ncbi:MAG: hypothetical protein KDC34_15245 [Saprospiraceae bacterium]|nr:hypothetical protein [Saprospiraceae bacterium]